MNRFTPWTSDSKVADPGWVTSTVLLVPFLHRDMAVSAMLVAPELEKFGSMRVIRRSA